VLREVVEQLRKTHEVSYRSTVDLSVAGFQQLGLVHGGALAGLLAYIAKGEHPTPVLVLALASFALGLLCNLVAMYHGRNGQQFQTEAHAVQLQGVHQLVYALQLEQEPAAREASRRATSEQYRGIQDLADATFRRAARLAAWGIVFFPVGAFLTALFFLQVHA
jgi:hypothetical protein